jgi:hypothetical protein
VSLFGSNGKIYTNLTIECDLYSSLLNYYIEWLWLWISEAFSHDVANDRHVIPVEAALSLSLPLSEALTSLSEALSLDRLGEWLFCGQDQP